MQKGVSTHSNTAPASHPRSPSKPWAHQPTEGVMWGFLVTVPQKPSECLLLGRRTLGHAMPVPLRPTGASTGGFWARCAKPAPTCCWLESACCFMGVHAVELHKDPSIKQLSFVKPQFFDFKFYFYAKLLQQLLQNMRTNCS